MVTFSKYFYRFWNQPSENTPECRMEMALHSRRAQKRQDEAKNPPIEKKWTPKLFADDGRPYNLNQAKVPYKLENESDKYVLTVQIYKYIYYINLVVVDSNKFKMIQSAIYSYY